MSHNLSSKTDLTLKTDKVIGRKDEIDRLRTYLYARGDRNYVYYWANGGLGKTRLLEELRDMTIGAGPGFHFSGIIDLYHTDTHSTSDVERAIVDGLDNEKKYFADYRQKRDQFTLLRERGADPTILEQYRQDLSGLFVDGFKEMALEARKLVLCFDTVELLQYESSLVEEKAGLDTVDTRLKPWLLTNLRELRNVLVVFSGRPQKQPPGELVNLQDRFEGDLKLAFGENLDVVELLPFDLEETKLLVFELTDREDLISDDYFPIVHRLTQGRPIFIHLLVDLLLYLSFEPARIFQMFDMYLDLADAPDDDEGLQKARHEIEIAILRALFYESGNNGEYLLNMALMPKGVDPDILNKAIGMPEEQGAELLALLEPLSFTKKYNAPSGSEKFHGERIFLHDEMYRLLTTPDFLPTLFIRERTVANALVTNYYTPEMDKLAKEIRSLPPDERIELRERLHKLQTERLYYMLVQNPAEGYAEYKRLSEEANKQRWVGFSMRLLDEFLRFYNNPNRRERFPRSGIPDEQVVRESAQLWVDRFYAWRRRHQADRFAAQVLENLGEFYLNTKEHLAIICNIYSMWSNTRAVLNGFEVVIVEKAKLYLEKLPSLNKCTPTEALARARLLNSIGYQYRLDGQLTVAADYYRQAKGAFRQINQPDELASLLTNLAYAYAKQGRMRLALPLAHEALRISEEIGDVYHTGLTLSTLSAITRMREKYSQAIEYGEEALQLFRELDDVHGKALAHLGIASAQRRKAKQDIENERIRKLEQAKQDLVEALQGIKQALDIAENAGLRTDIMSLRGELGRVYREMGHVTALLEGKEQALSFYRQSEHAFEEALQLPDWNDVDKADALQDLAEVLFISGSAGAAKEKMEEIENLLGVADPVQSKARSKRTKVAQAKYSPLGKLEMLRGQMAFYDKEYNVGLEHYVWAYIYFRWFSPDASEFDTMIEYLYKSLRDLPPATKYTLVQDVNAQIDKGELEPEAKAFVEMLENLLGV